MAGNSKKQRGKRRKKQQRDQLEQISQQVEMDHNEKQSNDPNFAQRALKKAMQHINNAIVELAYLTSNEGENSSGTLAIDEVNGKTAQEETAVEDEETEDDVHLSYETCCGSQRADEVMAQNTRMIKDVQMLRAQTEALLERHDKMKSQASACDT